MPFFLLEIDNAAFYATEKSSADPNPLVRWPWLDPFWGIVEDHIEGVLIRQPSARCAEIIVQAEPDFLARWNLCSDVINGRYPTGEMIVDREGTIHHVTTTTRTELTGCIANDLFAHLAPTRVDDLKSELCSWAEDFVVQKIMEVLGPQGLEFDQTDILTAAIRSLGKVDLYTADYADIDKCIDKALGLLSDQYSKSEDVR